MLPRCSSEGLSDYNQRRKVSRFCHHVADKLSTCEALLLPTVGHT